ncbi:hypothetical protein KC338_g241 [Hortaea werneckii]|nr:hypothetical protein KC338_g241 [Hortaea werneckii]
MPVINHTKDLLLCIRCLCGPQKDAPISSSPQDVPQPLWIFLVPRTIASHADLVQVADRLCIKISKSDTKENRTTTTLHALKAAAASHGPLIAWAGIVLVAVRFLETSSFGIGHHRAQWVIGVDCTFINASRTASRAIALGARVHGTVSAPVPAGAANTTVTEYAGTSPAGVTAATHRAVSTSTASTGPAVLTVAFIRVALLLLSSRTSANSSTIRTVVAFRGVLDQLDIESAVVGTRVQLKVTRDGEVVPPVAEVSQGLAMESDKVDGAPKTVLGVSGLTVPCIEAGGYRV